MLPVTRGSSPALGPEGGHAGRVTAGQTDGHDGPTRTACMQVVDWTDKLEFCAEHGVPVNDTWVIWGAAAAAAATAALQKLSVTAPTTAAAVAALDDLLSAFPDGHVRVSGTYPHAQWQGSRIEGFVVAQGEPVTEDAVARFRSVATKVSSLQMSLGGGVGGAPQTLFAPDRWSSGLGGDG